MDGPDSSIPQSAPCDETEANASPSDSVSERAVIYFAIAEEVSEDSPLRYVRWVRGGPVARYSSVCHHLKPGGRIDGYQTMARCLDPCDLVHDDRGSSRHRLEEGRRRV